MLMSRVSASAGAFIAELARIQGEDPLGALHARRASTRLVKILTTQSVWIARCIHRLWAKARPTRRFVSVRLAM